jgi:hypothetical protein
VIADGAKRNGCEVREVRRGQSLADAARDTAGPIVLAMREDDFEQPFREAIALGADRVIVLQNGFIDEVIAGQPVTRCVLWLTKKGDFERSARPTLVHGPRERDVQAWLESRAVPTQIASAETVAREGREKAAWSCLVGNGLHAHQRTLTEMLAEDEATAKRIVYEACDVAARVLDAEVTRDGAWKMVEDTRALLGWMKGSAKGLAWRSGKVVRWAEDELGDGLAAVANGEVVRRILAAAK